jgi:hypothetical protein
MRSLRIVVFYGGGEEGGTFGVGGGVEEECGEFFEDSEIEGMDS